MVFRLFVENKRGFDGGAKRVLAHIKEYINLELNTELRIFDRYDFDGLTKDEFDVVCKNIICDEKSQNYFIDYLPLTAEWRHFANSPRDGKFNRTAEYIVQTAKTLDISKNFKVKTAKVYALSHLLSESKLIEISKLLTDTRFCAITDSSKPLSLEEPDVDLGARAVPEEFNKLSDIQLYKYLSVNSFAMPKEVMTEVQEYFKGLNRNPTLVELYMIDSHFRLTHQLKDTRVGEVKFEEQSGNSPVKITLDEFINIRKQTGQRTPSITPRDIAFAGYDYIKAKGQLQDIVVEEDTPLIQMPVDVGGVTEQYLIGFSAKRAPFGTAFDSLPLGVAEQSTSGLTSYQALDIDLRPLTDKKERFKQAHKYENSTAPEAVLENVAVGNATLGIPCMLGNSIVNKSVLSGTNFSASVCGGIKHSFSGGKIAAGDIIIMVGSKMRLHDIGSDKFIQKVGFDIKNKIAQFMKNHQLFSIVKRPLSFENGLITGLLELNKGFEIDINRIINNKYLAAAYVALNCPNDRIAVVVSPDKSEDIKNLCYRTGLTSHTIGTVTEESAAAVKNGKKLVANLPLKDIKSFEINAQSSVLINDNSDLKLSLSSAPDHIADLPIKEAFIKNLKSAAVASRKGVSSQFDATIGGGCVIAPFGGSNEITPAEAFLCKIPTESGNTTTATALSYGCNPRISAVSPYHGAAFSVMESISRIVAVGANSINAKLALCQNINNPKNFESRWGDTFLALLGALSAQIGMGIPAISYDLSAASEDVDGLHNFSCFAVAGSKTTSAISSDFKSADSTVILVPMPTVAKTGLPDFDKAKVMYRQLHYLSQNGKILSAGVVNEGGIAGLVAAMSLGNGIGVDFEPLSGDILFAPLTASIVVETKNPGALEGMDTVVIGKTTSESRFNFNNEIVTLQDAAVAYSSYMQGVYPTRGSHKAGMVKVEPFTHDTPPFIYNKTAKPKVIVPVLSSFAPANDIRRAFDNAGADSELVYINHKYMNEAISGLAEKISGANILCLPPSGCISPALGVNIMQNPAVAESVMSLLKSKGLILGIEEGFDILLRTGLLINGEYITDKDPGAFLTENVTGLHYSGFGRVKITSNALPWFGLCETGDTYAVALSHSCGRFVADEATLNQLIENNQIAAQYVDASDKPSAKLPYNPDGSICAVESLTSPDGRILGKMGRSARRTRNCFINISGNKDQRIFESAVRYFM